MNATDQLAWDSMESTRTARHTRICDSCMDAAQDEGAQNLEAIRFLCIEVGADINDHSCEAHQEGRRCDCACH
jgi:hypothetical protein